MTDGTRSVPTTIRRSRTNSLAVVRRLIAIVRPTVRRMAVGRIGQIAPQLLQRFVRVSERAFRLLTGSNNTGMSQRLDRAGRLKSVVRKQGQHRAEDWQSWVIQRRCGRSARKCRAKTREQKAPGRLRSGSKPRGHLLVGKFASTPRIKREVRQLASVVSDQRAEQHIGPTLDATPQAIQLAQLIGRQNRRVQQHPQHGRPTLLMHGQHVASDRFRTLQSLPPVASGQDGSGDASPHLTHQQIAGDLSNFRRSIRKTPAVRQRRELLKFPFASRPECLAVLPIDPQRAFGERHRSFDDQRRLSRHQSCEFRNQSLIHRDRPAVSTPCEPKNEDDIHKSKADATTSPLGRDRKASRNHGVARPSVAFLNRSDDAVWQHVAGRQRLTQTPRQSRSISVETALDSRRAAASSAREQTNCSPGRSRASCPLNPNVQTSPG